MNKTQLDKTLGTVKNYVDTTKMNYLRYTTVQDFNNMNTTGIYSLKVSSNTNAPTTNNGTLIVEANVGTKYQIWIPDNSMTIYKRYWDSTNSKWGSWSSTLGNSISGNAATASKATQDSAGQQINTTYIKGLSVSGRTITYTKGNGSTATITTQDTTYSTGNASTAGLTKLYTGTGTATDGTMTQGAIKTALDGKASTANALQAWNCTIKCATWSRIFAFDGTATVGGSFIVNLRGTRANVVFNVTLLVNFSHSGQCNIVQLNNTIYSNLQVRGVVSSNNGGGYFEVYDTANSATNSTTQTLNVSLIRVSDGVNITKYTAFTDGTTIPTNYSEKGKLTTVSGTYYTGVAAKADRLTNARTLTIGSTGKTFDGSSNVSWSLSEIGAAASSHSHSYIPLAGVTDYTITGNLMLSDAGTTNGAFRGLLGKCGTNDYYRFGGSQTASNAGYLEIATGDDNNEPIYVRQYTGAFATLVRTATLLDGSGNTSFPGNVSANSFTEGGTALSSKYAAANHGNHVPLQCGSVSNWNDALYNGWYMAAGAANQPAGDSNTWFMGYVLCHNTNYVIQTLYQFTAGGVNAAGIPIYMRTKQAGTWGGWTSNYCINITGSAMGLQYSNNTPVSTGSATQPVYFSNGLPIAGKSYISRSSVSDIGWERDDSNAPVTVSAIAFWNGAYTGSSSNLTYCKHGAFGTIVTKNQGDYAPASHNHTVLTGEVKINNSDGTFNDAWHGTGCALKVGGLMAIGGSTLSSGEYRSYSANAFRAVQGDYGFFIRNDGSHTYFMLTNAGDQYGNWNNFRPIVITNSTGETSITGTVNKWNGFLMRYGNHTGGADGYITFAW